MIQNDTIVAIATGSSRAGVGVVRLSGPSSFQIASKIFHPKKQFEKPWPAQVLLFGNVLDNNNESIDQGYAVFFPNPHSFTGEDVVEIQVHGSPIVLQQIVESCCENSARMAAPGEFTKRSFLNGKMDLVQAEAVAELIHAESKAEAQAAKRRLEGKASAALHQLREETISVLAECEADVDFPEEGLSLANRPTLLKQFQSIYSRTQKLLATYSANQRLHQGFIVVLVGKPNVGKSSLFNSILQMDRAIVTPIPGTTRDVLREEIILDGRRIRLMDTAGLHEDSLDQVEKLGMAKTQEEIQKADLICLVCDSSLGFTQQDENVLKNSKTKEVWVVWNKMDLPSKKSFKKTGQTEFYVSALTFEGLDAFQRALIKKVKSETDLALDGGISNDRQKGLLEEFLQFLEKAEAELKKNASPEFLAFELRQAYRALSRILGLDDDIETILGEIFSRFCIGK